MKARYSSVRKRFTRAAVVEAIQGRIAYYRSEFDRVSDVSWAQHKFLVKNNRRSGVADLRIGVVAQVNPMGSTQWLLACAVALEEMEALLEEIEYWQGRRMVI